MRRFMAAFVMLGAICGTAAAKDLDFGFGLSQKDFKEFSREAGAALAYRNMAPAAPLGLTGFDVGVEATVLDIRNNSAYWQSAFKGDAPSYLVVPRVRVRKGIPWGIDLGAMYSYVPDSNVKVFGAEVSKAILEGTAVSPALGVRATYTKLSGVDDLSLQTVGLDASVSKGFVFITPYAGAGIVYIDSEAKGNLQDETLADLGFRLEKETLWEPRVFGGLELKPFPLFRLVAEAEYMERPAYSLKLAIGF